MTDRLTPEQRSWNMSRIKGKNTKPEIIVRSLLHRMGYRFRLHVRELPGKPDIVLPKHRTVIEVRGCFFHRHRGCKNCTSPSTNAGFWQKKFRENVVRDRKHELLLRRMGWKVLVIWECKVNESEKLKRDIFKKLT